MEWNGIGMEMEWKCLPQKKSMQNGMELEWKWNGNFTTKEIDAKWNENGMELGWKWDGNKWPPRHGS